MSLVVVDGVGEVSPARRWGLSMLFVLVGTAGATSFGLLGWFIGLAVLGELASTGWRICFATGFGLLLALFLGLLQPTRRAEVVLAGILLGARFPADWPLGGRIGLVERVRSGGWFAAHVLVGAVAFLAGFLGLVVGVGLLLAPWTYPAGVQPLGIGLLPVTGQGVDWVICLVGAAVLSLTIVLAAVLPSVAARAAEVVLGPSRRELLAIADARAARAAERNRVARDLHDSVGHDLSLISVLATAAVRTAEGDPRHQSFLDGIRSGASAALANLDEALCVLRDGTGHGRWQETLADLDDLLARFRAAGLTIALSTSGALADLREPVGRAGYRIVTEALTNASRYGAGRVALVVDRRREVLLIECTNEVRRRSGPHSSGRGLVGVRERVALLGGSVTYGETDGRWTLRVSLPAPGRS